MAEAQPIPKEQKALLAVLALVGLFMFYKKAYMPQGKQINDLTKQIKDTNSKIEGIKKKVARMAQLEADYEVLKTKVAEAEKQLPKSEELPELIRSITKIGSKHGIEIDNWRISSVIPKQYYKEHTYSFVVNSSYHKAAQFFVDICQRERIMTVKDVKITPSAIETGNDMSVSFTLVVYTYKE
ncbi:MAG: type 4a pilus biogenesis protein PilO [Elusimicrobiota bacterium]|nr:type 4a pilus biogenesis protein PilO [Elusimicrobiota bacterium]